MTDWNRGWTGPCIRQPNHEDAVPFAPEVDESQHQLQCKPTPSSEAASALQMALQVHARLAAATRPVLLHAACHTLPAL